MHKGSMSGGRGERKTSNKDSNPKDLNREASIQNVVEIKRYSGGAGGEGKRLSVKSVKEEGPDLEKNLGSKERLNQLKTTGKGEEPPPPPAGSMHIPSHVVAKQKRKTSFLRSRPKFEGPPPTAEEIKEWYAIEPVQLPKFISFLCQYIMIYETLICILLVLNLTFFPYNCFFNVHDANIADFIFALDPIYAVDVILRLIIEEWRHKTQTKCMVFIFPYSLQYCLMDVLSLCPFDRIVLSLSNMDDMEFDDLNSVEWWQTLTLLRAYRIWIYFRQLEINGLLYETVIFVVKFSVIYLGFILFVSVGFFSFTNLEEVEYFLLTRNRNKLSGTWAADFRNNPLTDTPIGFFILSINFATVVVTTVGYGDIAPKTEGEMFGSIVVMLIGAIFMSGYFQSQITSFCLQLDGARLDLFHRLDGIVIALRQAQMGEFFVAKMEQYYKCLWTYREGTDRVLFMQQLPISFQEDISFDICLEMFHNSNLFRGLDEAFLRAVSKIATIALYIPGMIVCQYGGYANKMYYIIQGECQAMSKHDLAKKAAILRAGSIVGETNLFFSCPYTISVETRSCCQLMILDKEELMRIFSKFENELGVLRSRCQTQINDMYFFYEKKGIDPVCWVEVSEDAEEQTKATRESLDLSNEPKWPLLNMRWGYGFNDVVTEDVILDSEDYVIFDSICEDKAAKKNHATPYMTCVVPEILATEVTFINVWNITIIIFAILQSFYGPYCLAFSSTSNVESYICSQGGTAGAIDYLTDLMYIVDVFVEILGAAPVEGLYYKFQDGLNTKKASGVFYLDILAAIPLSFVQGIVYGSREVNVVMKSAKIWKVIRYLNFMDNVHPRHVFWFRLMQTCLVLVYGIHFIACTVFIQACPFKTTDGGDLILFRECTKQPNWLWSYILRARADDEVTLVDDTITVRSLASKSPYLISFFYASATLTSAGFGDFSPQNDSEMCWAVVFTLIGFFLICYYTSVLTSALSCIVKPRLEFQQKLLAVRRFMQYYKLPDSLQRRVEQFYEQQHQVRHGINLPHGTEHFLFDAPDYLKNDYLYTATVVLLDGIPLFSKVESKYIIKMASVMRRFLIPPNVMFLHMGEVRRAMYVVQAGSVGVYEGGAPLPKHILEATSHFGIRDLLFGEPSHYTIRTLSYCYIYEITNDQVVEVFEEDAELLDMIDDEREERHDEIEDMYNQYATLEREQQADRYIETPSWMYFRPTKNSTGRRFHQYLEYVNLFKEIPGGKILRYFLQNGTVNPGGAFAKWWTCWMSLVACMTVMLLFMETFMYIRVPYMRIFQWTLDSFFYVDIYIKMHWGYYQPTTGLLISHPMKTASLYISRGSFFADIVFCTPLELIVFAFGKTDFMGYGDGASWYTKLRWIRFLQIKRIPQIFSIVHGIFVRRTLVLLLLFVSLTLIVCTMVGAVAVYIACPWEANNWELGDEYRMPACNLGHWANTKFGQNHAETQRVLVDITSRWLFGLYYVSQVLLVIGFGDMITLDTSEIMLLILMSVFGFVFMRCVLADMTAAEVDSDEIRARFTDSMKTLIQVMQKEKVNKKLIATVHDHLNNMWKRSKGLQPGQLFNDLHPSLESDVFRSFVGDTLRKIAVFRDFTPNVLRTLCLYLKKLHFLKGERLMQYGNLEYEMYIIVAGKVWITDRKLSYGCTLGKYETFGESSMLTFAPRRYTGIAATGVEAFVIARHDFDALIERYPKVKDILTTLLHNGDYDYFEYKIYEMIDRLKELKGDDRDRQIDILQARTNEIKSVVSGKSTLSAEEAGDLWSKKTAKNPFRYLLSKIIASGNDDDGLPFLYFVGKRNKINGKYSVFPPLIHPNCAFSKLYFTGIYLFCLVSPALAIYEYSFSQGYLEKIKNNDHYGPVNTDEEIQALIHKVGNEFEYFLLTFIVMSLITPFQNEHGLFVKDFTAIAMNYIFSVDGMWLDMVASFPGLIWDDVRIILMLTRSMRLYRYYSHYGKKADDLSVSPFRLKIQLSVSTFIMLAHFIACVFYLISDCEDAIEDMPCRKKNAVEFKTLNLTYTWTAAFVIDRDIESIHDEGMHRWRWWLRSLYWVISVISTTGFGDIVPQNVTEMVVGIICFFSGAFILSIILSSFTAGMTSITKAHRAYLYQVKLLLKYLNNVGLSPIRLGQANAYFDLLWERCRGRMYHEVTVMLPITLRIQVSNALFSDTLNKVTLFNLNNPLFIKQIANRVKHSIYLPGVCIVKEGDLGSTMFIVMKGYVSGITASDSTAMELKKVYLVGDTFGKLPCLFHNEWYRKSYRAEEHTEVLEIHSRDIIHLATVYPDFWKLLKAFVEINYDAEGESDCIFSPQRARQKNIYDLGEDYQKTEDVKQKRGGTKGSAKNEFAEHDSHFRMGHDDHGFHGYSHHVRPSMAAKKKKAANVKDPIQFLYDAKHLTKLTEKTTNFKSKKSMLADRKRALAARSKTGLRSPVSVKPSNRTLNKPSQANKSPVRSKSKEPKVVNIPEPKDAKKVAVQERKQEPPKDTVVKKDVSPAKSKSGKTIRKKKSKPKPAQ